MEPQYSNFYKKKNTFFWIFALVLILSLLILYFQFWFNSHRIINLGSDLEILHVYSKHSNNNNNLYCAKLLKSQVSKCLLKQLEGDKSKVWSKLAGAMAVCCSLLQKTMPIVALKSANAETKYVILPSKNSPDIKECTVLTIGVGNTIEAEKKLKENYPECKFIGVEPMLEYGKVYQSIGKLINAGVSDVGDKIIEASVMTDGWNYGLRNVSTVGFLDLLSMVNSTNIDFLMLDAEGAEYKIFPLLKKNTLNQYQICQMPIEIHGPGKTYKINDEELGTLLLDVINNGSFLPLVSDIITFPGGHFDRMFWFNFESEYCANKYLHDYCLVDN